MPIQQNASSCKAKEMSCEPVMKKQRACGPGDLITTTSQ